MAIHTLKTRFSALDLLPVLNDLNYQSSNGALQTRGRTGNRWQFTMPFNNLGGAERSDLWGALMAMQGTKDRLRVIFDGPVGYQPQGSADDRMRLDVAHSAGATRILVRNADLDTAGILRRGDFIQIGNELKICTTDLTTGGVNVDGFGIWPELHADYPITEQIVLRDPSGVFHIGSPPAFQARPRRTNDWLGNSRIALVEDVLAAPHDRWFFWGTTDGWTGTNATLTTQESQLDVAATSGNPQLISPALSFAGSDYTNVRARIRQESPGLATWDGELRWQRTGRNNYTLDYMMVTPEPPGWDAGEWVTVDWNIYDGGGRVTTGLDDWLSGNITALRFDFSTDATMDVKVDWIMVT